MQLTQANGSGRDPFLNRHPVACYFVSTFAISWTAAFAVASPYIFRHQPIPKFAGLMMFPAMLLGPSLAGILMSRLTGGPQGFRDLFERMRRVRFPLRWYSVLLVPPVLVLTVLLLLRTFQSPVYTPNRFWIGASFGCVAGFFEEIGWSGFAFPRMLARGGGFGSAIFLGVLWGTWHIPVIDYLGTATPHGAYWLRFFLAFTAAMTAMRVLICWVSSRTNSVVIAQLLHAVSTGSLVVFSPPSVTPGQEAAWYALYAATLWIVVGILAIKAISFAPIESPGLPAFDER